MINEHDHTKKMISIIRGNLFEDESSDTISPSENDSTYKDEVKKISDSVDPRVQITKFKIYPKDRDVQFDGRLDSGINFFMSVRAMKLKISITDDSSQPTQIYLDDELLKTIQKLNG